MGNDSPALFTGAGSPDCDDPLLEAQRDDINNVENVFVVESAEGAGIPTGTWTVKVKAYEVNTDGNPNAVCRAVVLDPKNAAVGQANCEAAAGCQWDAVNEVCGDPTWDVVFALVATGGAVPAPGAVDGLTVGKNGNGTLQLSWNPDCGNATTYGVYRGGLNIGYSSIQSEPGLCAVSGQSTAVPEGPGAADFFLVVPNGLELEGSYGVDSTGEQRAPASRGCFPQAAVDECAS